MIDQEKEIDVLESEFPSLSGSAFSLAFNNARKSGQSVFVAENDTIYEILPDGTRKEVKKIEGPRAYKVGEEIKLR